MKANKKWLVLLTEAIKHKVKSEGLLDDASRELGISVSSISNSIKGLSKTAGGFIWKS